MLSMAHLIGVISANYCSVCEITLLCGLQIYSGHTRTLSWFLDWYGRPVDCLFDGGH